MEIFIVNVYHPILELNVKLVSFFDFIYLFPRLLLPFLFFFFFFSLIIFEMKKKYKKIGGLEIGEQTILTNFHNGLTSNGSLNWDLSIDLCGQTGIVCDSSIPKRVTQLYSILFSSSFFFFPSSFHEIKQNSLEIWGIKDFQDQFHFDFLAYLIYKLCKTSTIFAFHSFLFLDFISKII